MTRGSESVIGLRVRLKLLHADPGRDSEELPSEWITGTIIGSYCGVYDRIHYYVLLDDALELDTETRAVRVVKRGEEGCVDQPTAGRVRRTNIISVGTSQDYPPPPRDLLGPALLQLGRGRAGYVDLMFVRPLPSKITLEDNQAESRVPLTERKYEAIGWAEVEVISFVGRKDNHG